MIFLMLFIEFFKVGLFTFGGGFAMIPLIEDIVVSYGWLTEAELSLLFTKAFEVDSEKRQKRNYLQNYFLNGIKCLLGIITIEIQ